MVYEILFVIILLLFIHWFILNKRFYIFEIFNNGIVWFFL